MTDKELGTAAGEIFAKAFTLGYKTGREYVPVGGRVLTAEQVEDVEALVATANPYSAPADRLRALFPATEPAEPVVPNPEHPYFAWEQGYQAAVTDSDAGVDGTRGNAYTSNPYSLGESEPDPATEPAESRCTFYAQTEHGDIQCELPDGHAAHHRIDPAPAEPAEEETKAEVHDPDALAKRLAWIWHDGWDACGERERGYLRRAAEMAHSHYASSPVVPAPTETGPWQNVDAIQVGVPFEDKEGSQLVKLADGKFGYLSYPRETPETLAKYAPFVAAAEEG